MRHNILNAIKVSVLALILSFGLSYVYAWTAPTKNPPAGNVAAPINTSATAQIKAGDFSIGGLFSGNKGSFAQLGVGTQNPATGVALDVAGIIKTTALQLVTGAGVGKVLTSTDANGTVAWMDAAQVASGGGALPEEIYYTTLGTFDFTVPSWMTNLVVEAVAGGGGGGAGIITAGGTGGTSSFGPVGAPIIRATGGMGGGGGLYNSAGTNGGNGSGVGGFINVAPYAFFGSSYGAGGDGGVYPPGTYGPGGAGGMAGYSKGLISVTPGQTMKVIIGAGGAGGVYYGNCYYGCGTAGKSGYVHLTYMPAPPLANSQTFTSSGAFTVPAGVTSITVQTWGGGGAGTPGRLSYNYDYSASTITGGGGGASGGYAESILTVTPGQTYNITVGAGGVGATTPYTIYGSFYGIATTAYRGNPGGATTFGTSTSLVTATGGLGGKATDYFSDGYGTNGLYYCYDTSGYAATAGIGSGNFLSLGGNNGTQCNQSNVGASGGTGYSTGGYAYGAGGNGSSYGGPQFNGGDGAVVVSW